MDENIVGKELEAWKSICDWKCAFYEAMHGRYFGYRPEDDEVGPIVNVIRVVVCDEGDNDGPEWVAVVEWSGPEGKFAVMAAGCDYTGWDCQAGGAIEFYDSEGMALTELTPEQAERLGVPHDANRKRETER